MKKFIVFLFTIAVVTAGISADARLIHVFGGVVFPPEPALLWAEYNPANTPTMTFAGGKASAMAITNGSPTYNVTNQGNANLSWFYGTGAINGNLVITSTTTGSDFETANPVSFTLNAGWYVAFIAQTPNTFTQSYSAIFSINNFNPGLYVHSSVIDIYAGSTDHAFNDLAVPAAAVILVEAWCDTSNVMHAALNGTVSGTTFSVTAATCQGGTTGLLGIGNGSGAELWQGSIGRGVVYGVGVPSASSILTIRSVLKAYAGI